MGEEELVSPVSSRTFGELVNPVLSLRKIIASGVREFWVWASALPLPTCVMVLKPPRACVLSSVHEVRILMVGTGCPMLS